jgi:hypothetical protein
MPVSSQLSWYMAAMYCDAEFKDAQHILTGKWRLLLAAPCSRAGSTGECVLQILHASCHAKLAGCKLATMAVCHTAAVHERVRS